MVYLVRQNSTLNFFKVHKVHANRLEAVNIPLAINILSQLKPQIIQRHPLIPVTRLERCERGRTEGQPYRNTIPR